MLGLTAIGRAGPQVPDRAGGRPATHCGWSGRSAMPRRASPAARATGTRPGALVDIYRRPVPSSSAGQALAPHAHAMMDVSDGLLLDARRMAEASRCGDQPSSSIALPLSRAFVAERGQDSRRGCSPRPAATIMRCSPRFRPTSIRQRLSLPRGTRVSRIGSLAAGEASLSLTYGGEPVELPERLGFEHQGNRTSRAFPLRQWLIGLSGLASGMTLALLLR